jgi:long-subunit acyl-CoA synthetase (AMP-forming)/pyrroloquinoline quinone (PQQ) biosynthesis protein C
MSTVITKLFKSATATPNRVALKTERRDWSYSELAAEVARVRFLITERKPRAIGILADNGAHWVVCDLAAVGAGIPVVPIPAFFTPLQIAHVIKDAGLDVVLSERDFPGLASATLDVAGHQLYWVITSATAKAFPLGTAKITYTSGTTGTPKGVCLSQAHLETVAQSLVTVLGADLAQRHIAVLPLAILLENVAGLYPTLLSGATYVVPSLKTLGYSSGLTPDAATLTKTLEHFHATSCILVPELLRLLVDHLGHTGQKLAHLTYAAVGGARVPPVLIAQARNLGIPAYEGYGLSECGSVVALNTPTQDRTGTVGHVLPHVNLSVASDGEIIVHHPGFLGYLGGATVDTAHFATGDIGDVTDGVVTISGRKKNIIITALGRNIAPEWIESELGADGAIAQCAVFGDDTDHLTALIVPRSATIPDSMLAAAVAAANARLPIYAQIGKWHRVAAFTTENGTLTPNHRLRRDAIKALHFRTDSNSTFFDRLVASTAAEQAALFAVPQIVDGLAGRISRATYIAYLAEAYHHVKHTVPLLRETLAHLPHDKAWLKDVLQDYIDEETGHEHWILDDIANAGGDADAVATSQPAPATAAMVDFAYHYIRHRNPIGFFGMVFVLEGTSIQLASRGAQALMSALQLPPNCFSYLTSHGALDLDHMDFFRTVVNRINDPKDQAAIIDMAKNMFTLFANVFRSIPHPHPKDLNHAA